MNSSTAFLNSLGKRLSSMSLYGPGHPSRDRAMEQVIEDMSMLLPCSIFSMGMWCTRIPCCPSCASGSGP